MEQLSLDDYTATLDDVVRSEGTVSDGETLFWQGELFYRQNGDLLAAHKRAAEHFVTRDGQPTEVSPKFLTELTRYFELLGPDRMKAIVNAYMGVNWKRDKPYAISNNTTPWLGRWLKMAGFQVDTRSSKIDEAWEREHGKSA